jgi:hypothetical protein
MQKAIRKYIVQTAAAQMPASCWGRYRRVAVLGVDDASISEVAMISTRAKHLVEIVASWEKCNVGTSEKSAYSRALAAANELCAKLNAALPEGGADSLNREDAPSIVAVFKPQP